MKLNRTTSLGTWRAEHKKYQNKEKSTKEEISMNDRTKNSVTSKQPIIIIDKSVVSGLKQSTFNDRSKFRSHIELSSRLFPKDTSKGESSERSLSPSLRRSQSSLKVSSKHLSQVGTFTHDRQTQMAIARLESAIIDRKNGSVVKRRHTDRHSTPLRVKDFKVMTLATSSNSVIETSEREKLHKFVESDTKLELLNYDGKDLPPYLKSSFLKQKQ